MSHKLFRICTFCALLQLTLVLVAHGETVVTWKSLKKLDVLAERCEALSDAHDVAELRKLVKPVKDAATIVAADPVPVGAKAPDQVKVLQSDLKSLTDVLTDTSTQTDAELTAILASVHPIVEKLMEGAGMPHVHENEATTGRPAKEIRP